jgi:murein DD-endopeptidase MepM/ murein hydrolase activator NlpD
MIGRACACLALLMMGGAASAQSRHAIFVLPVATTCISSSFGQRIIPDHPQAGTFHSGVDLPAPEGTEVRAVAFGKVLWVQHNDIGGLEVLIEHDGFVGVYSHLGRVMRSLEGTMIAAGEVLGAVGHTGLTFGPHLHFGVLVGDRAVDPAGLLGLPACNGVTTAQRLRLPLAELLLARGKWPLAGRSFLLKEPAIASAARAAWRTASFQQR